MRRPLRVVTTGSRNYMTIAKVMRFLQNLPKETQIHCGDCPTGADWMVTQMAPVYGHHVTSYPAGWKSHGRAAGPIRNRRVLREGKPDKVVAFVHGSLEDSRGTHDMVKQARKKDIPVRIVED